MQSVAPFDVLCNLTDGLGHCDGCGGSGPRRSRLRCLELDPCVNFCFRTLSKCTKCCLMYGIHRSLISPEAIVDTGVHTPYSSLSLKCAILIGDR